MKSVYLVMNDCPADWGPSGVVAVFADRRAATRWMLEQKGKDPVANQYYEVQRWTVRQ